MLNLLKIERIVPSGQRYLHHGLLMKAEYTRMVVIAATETVVTHLWCWNKNDQRLPSDQSPTIINAASANRYINRETATIFRYTILSSMLSRRIFFTGSLNRSSLRTPSGQTRPQKTLPKRMLEAMMPPISHGRTMLKVHGIGHTGHRTKGTAYGQPRTPPVTLGQSCPQVVMGPSVNNVVVLTASARLFNPVLAAEEVSSLNNTGLRL